MSGAVTIFVRGLKVDAEIGVYAHEHGRSQPLVLDITLEAETLGATRLADTIDYEAVAGKAEAIAAEGHILLVEDFAERVARACLEDDRVTSVTVRVDKPEALAPRAAGAGVQVRLTR